MIPFYNDYNGDWSRYSTISYEKNERMEDLFHNSQLVN